MANKRYLNVTQEIRIVFQRKRTGVSDTKGVPKALWSLCRQHLLCLSITGILQWNLTRGYVRANVVNVNVVTQQRMHTVHRNKLFSQCVRGAIVVWLGGADDTSKGMVNRTGPYTI